MQTITTSVMAATARRAVQVMPRPTHHNSAQPMMTGTMMSSCMAARFVALARARGTTDPDADGAADFHGIGAFELDEAGAIARAGIGAAGAFHGEQPVRGCGLIRFQPAGRFGRSRPERQRGNHGRKQDVSHPRLLSRTRRLGYPTN